MAAPPSPPPEPPDESWMATYADAITLLMAFFVLLVSFSKVDLDMLDKVANGVAENFSDTPTESKQNVLQDAIKETVINEGADDVAKVATDAVGSITLELDSGAFFRPGSAELVEQAIPFLEQVYDEIATPLYKDFNITVEGHTDDEPISTDRFPSNWELSGNRAATVVRFFLSATSQDDRTDINKQPYGVAKNRLRAVGYADTQPKMPNRDEEGFAIVENQRANRRVIIRINRQPIYEELKIPKFRRKSRELRRESVKIES
ncbi:MAG: hypothetical protein CMM45_00050 [Rhodospirillaceae bacterium]|nr:hypothetical protein [Rhodospirillaceae bacterium]